MGTGPVRGALRALLACALILTAGPSIGHAEPARIDARLAAQIARDPLAVVDALVSVQRPADAARWKAFGVTPLRVFDQFGVVYVAGVGRDVLRVAHVPGVQGVFANTRLRYDGDTDMVASRAREAWDGKKSTSTTPAKVGSTVVDGRGVGVAIVDSGIDGDHPDFKNAISSNKKFVCTTGVDVLVDADTDTCYGDSAISRIRNRGPYNGCTNDFWVDVSDTDTTGGHGTHVAGIVAGRGSASDGRFTGAAPGATLYGLGVGEVNSIFTSLEAFNWISCNAATVSPKIRVVNNSWSPPAGPYSANDPINKAVNVLVSKGIVVVFSASNGGGNGSDDRVNPYAKNPTKGVINVANYDDLGNGSRAGHLDASSSRGKSSDTNPNDWPDVSAPGTNITSTGARTGVYVPTGTRASYEPYYTEATGTSMSAPHVAGIVALLFQANPALTPADVEDVLEDHAVPFATPGGYVADVTNGTTGTNFGAGHGLVDAIASLHDARVGATGGSALPQVSQNPHAGLVLDLDGQVVAAVQWTFPHGVEVRLSEQVISSGDPAAYPLAAGQAAAFRIVPPSGSAFLVAATVTADAVEGTVDMAATYVFGAVGTYRIESQINFGSGLRAIDAWTIDVI